MPSIVTVNVSETVAPTPSNLQNTGAFISQGGTNTSPGTKTLLTQLSDLTNALATALALSALTWSGGVATATTGLIVVSSGTYNSGSGLVTLTLASPHGLLPGAPIFLALTGTGSVSDLDGSFVAGAGTTGDTLTFTATTGLTLTISGGDFYYPLAPAIGDQFLTTIAGVTPAAYNGTVLATVTEANQFTYLLSPTPGGSATVQGTYTASNVSELVAMATTFFAQGAGQAVYVLELGAGEVNAGVTFLTAWITANPGVFYSYLVPRAWDGNANYIALAGQFNAANAKTYFFTTTTLRTYGLYQPAAAPNTLKSICTLIESPAYGAWAANALVGATYSDGLVTATTTLAHGVQIGQWFKIAGCTPSGYNGWFIALAGTTAETLVYAPLAALGMISVEGTLVQSQYTNAGIPPTEFSLAQNFQNWLRQQPSTTNKVPPFQFSFAFGVTPFPTQGNAAILQTLENASVNVIGTGAEGGISDLILLYGTMMDGNSMNFWYAADWVQINIDLNVSNAVINGSNNPINPLYYDQDGINRLQAVAANVLSSGASFGLVLGTVTQTGLYGNDLTQALDNGTFDDQAVVNAVPFVPYSIANPGDYKLGQYAGLSAIFTPQLGFTKIIFNLNVSSFVATP